MRRLPLDPQLGADELCGSQLAARAHDVVRWRWPVLASPLLVAAAGDGERQREERSQMLGKNSIATLVKKKSAIRIVIEITTTVRVVLLPTPAVPPVVVCPK